MFVQRCRRVELHAKFQEARERTSIRDKYQALHTKETLYNTCHAHIPKQALNAHGKGLVPPVSVAFLKMKFNLPLAHLTCCKKHGTPSN